MKIEDIDILDEKVRAARNIVHDIKALTNIKGHLMSDHIIFINFPAIKEGEMPSVDSRFYHAVDAILKESLLPTVCGMLCQKKLELNNL